MKDKTLFQALKLIYRCDKKAFVMKVFYTVLQSILPLVNLYVLKLVVDEVTSLAAAPNNGAGAMAPIGIYTTIFAGVFLLNRLVGVFSSVNNDVLVQKLIDYINNLIQTQSVQLDLAYYDNPDYHDTFHRAQQEAAFRPVRILESFVDILGSVISLAGIVAMLCTADWMIILIMVVAVIPSFAVRLYKSRQIYKFRRETTQDMRRSMYYGQVLSSSTFAKEVRVFGLASHFRDLYLSLRRQLVGKLFRISRRLALYDGVTSLVEAAALVAIMVALMRPVMTAKITIGSFVMLFEAYRRGQGHMSSLVSGVSGLYEHKLFISNLFDFLKLRPNIVSPSNPAPFPDRIHKVEFDHIWFHYPYTRREEEKGRWVLQNYCLTAQMGDVTRLEGENGFGKSTLLKLLLRLYDPQQGCVRINGIDVREFDLNELRQNISVIFQDHVRFYCTAKENIEFGDLKHSSSSNNRLQEAIRLADAQPVIDSLSKGLDTPLGRMFNDGEELSMGQWQRLALARQLYSQAPILIFDEPTAWMDVKARETFSLNLEELRKDHIVILISHLD